MTVEHDPTGQLVEVEVTDLHSLNVAYRVAPLGGWVDMTTHPPSAVILASGKRVRVRYGDTVTRHEGGVITVSATTRQGVLW